MAPRGLCGTEHGVRPGSPLQTTDLHPFFRNGARANLNREIVAPRAHFFPRPYVNSGRVSRNFSLAFVLEVAGSVARAERLRIEERDVHSGSHARSYASRPDGELSRRGVSRCLGGARSR